jgi:hypothetical protein
MTPSSLDDARLARGLVLAVVLVLLGCNGEPAITTEPVHSRLTPRPEPPTEPSAAATSKTGAQKASRPRVFPRVFIARDFSEKYYAKVHLLKPSEYSNETFIDGAGFVAILKGSDEEVIRVGSVDEPNNLSFWLHDGGLESNIRELPYGEQSVVVFEDFDFDGDRDFAISNGHNSCYGGPSFAIHLATGGGFVHSPAFSRLAQDYCGMFDIDHASKRIRTMQKSGCCWHEYTTFAVASGRPFPVEVTIKEVDNDDFATTTTRRLVGGQWVTERTRRKFEEE